MEIVEYYFLILNVDLKKKKIENILRRLLFLEDSIH